MKNLFVNYLLVALLMLLYGSAAFAANWFCDFEQTEGYTPGPINGQNGWWASSAIPSVIADGSAPSGSQVLYMAGPTEAGNAVSYPNANADLIKCTAYINGPTGAAGHAALHALDQIKHEIEAWAKKHNVRYTQKTVKYTHRLAFDDDTMYTLFSMTWNPEHQFSWMNFRIVNIANETY